MFVIWSYKEGKYIEGDLKVPIEFDTEKEAEDFILKESRKDVKKGLENTLIEARENGYMIEEI